MCLQTSLLKYDQQLLPVITDSFGTCQSLNNLYFLKPFQLPFIKIEQLMDFSILVFTEIINPIEDKNLNSQVRNTYINFMLLLLSGLGTGRFHVHR